MALVGALGALPLVALKAYLWSDHATSQADWLEDWHATQVRKRSIGEGGGGFGGAGLLPRSASGLALAASVRGANCQRGGAH